MGGSSFEDNCEIISSRTLVLVGKTGNGKSATGNSILGMKSFNSKRSSSGVTVTSELQATSFGDSGQIINVIDTPGLFDFSPDFEFIGKEIVKCINMAKDGIHAFLIVVSIRNRFSEDEKSAIRSLQTLFGKEIYNYMIIVFTGGDELEDGDTLEGILDQSPEALKETLGLCGNRSVLFDNKTKDDTKKSNQVHKLLSLVDVVSRKSGGKPYSNEIFTELKNRTKELQEEEISMNDEKFKRIFDVVESKLKDTTKNLERLLAEEQAARMEAEEKVNAAQIKSDKNLKLEQQLVEERAARVKAENEAKAAQKRNQIEEISNLKEKLENADQKREEKLPKQKENRRVEAHWKQRAVGGCLIL